MSEENAPERKRIYLGGLAPDVTAADVEKRFHTFGTLSSVELVLNEFTGKCRGFAYLNLDITPANWKKCYSMYNGTKWKGQQLKLEEAKTDYMTKWVLKKEWEEAKAKEENPKPKKKRSASVDGYEAADMTLVNEKNVDGRKGWKRGRYGRAVAVMKLKKTDGTPFTYDPSHYKNNLEKLFGSVRPLPISKLTWSYDQTSNHNLVEDEVAVPEPRKPATESLIKANEQRLEALKRRQEEQERSRKMIKESLSNIDGKKSEGHIVFEDSDDEAQQKGKSLFDSDSDSEEAPGDFDIEINEAFEGEAGRKRLALQKRFGGDERFKLDEDFMGDEEIAQREEAKRAEETKEEAADDDDDINVKQENSVAMSILNSLFQDAPAPVVEKPAEVNARYWKPVTRFDPDAEDADEMLVDETLAEEADDHPAQAYEPSTAPDVSDEKKVVINTNLKSVFSGNDEGFTLFGGSESESDDEPVTPFAFPTSQVEASPTPLTRLKSVTAAPAVQRSGALFFFHLYDPEMHKRSNFKEDRVFARTGTIEEVTAAWQEQRSELTQEYKRKHKSATRKKLKMKRKYVK
ncbi:hypothetical protein K493DRAFT_360475 [Basidiobolus meristosporus CBS 931.73]|uniref:RRM domain-containing protein n=1 Tax=Basidiobolus meristosporus CBS 931.73 TaxID=1314790 RepID=A0A1Y1XHK3_9FUNG|nr:hypothetical protein K493DRAFT_360475 [Basidiobolus meristosporus CBS 931.73]|eukprot:ORX85217.1 hypothetical protein K493DRAFT_360475 [Basidiobolus meristosporus CBS 931.73]